MKKNILLEVNKIKKLMGINEDGGDEFISAGSDIADSLQKPIDSFVDDLSQIVSDPKVQAVLKAGNPSKPIELGGGKKLSDGDDGDDKKIKIGSKGWTSVKDLKPTQNEIGASESLKNILTDPYNSLTSFLSGKADVGKNPIVTYNGKYIIDGHHRWSQVFAANPDAMVPTLDLVGSLSPLDILKIVHLSIASGAGKLPLSSAKGVNLLKASRDDVYKMVVRNLNDKAIKIWNNSGKVKCENARCENLAKLIWSNVEKLQSNGVISGAPSRTKMPQTDAEESTQSVINRVTQGSLNYINPSNVKVESLNKSNLIKLIREVIKEHKFYKH